MTLRRVTSTIANWFPDLDPVDTALRITLVAFLMSKKLHSANILLQTAILCVTTLGLVVPGWHRSRRLWIVFASLIGLKTAEQWFFQDNLHFLQTWWCLAVAIGLTRADADKVIRENARVLLGLSFLLAMIWKGLLSPDYWTGGFFLHSLLADSRFFDLTRLIGGLSQNDIAANWEIIVRGTSARADAAPQTLATTSSLLPLALALTWWTAIIEVFLALSTLWPRVGHGPSAYRHQALLLFCLTTYLAAPVWTFGWGLMTLGFATLRPEQRGLKSAYVIAFMLVLVFGEVEPVRMLTYFMLGRS